MKFNQDQSGWVCRLTGLAAVVWALTTCIHLLSCFYHLRAGEQSLNQALGSPDWLDWWYIGPRTVYDQDALHRAIDHLQQIPGSAQAWRLLGRGYVAQGDWLAGIHALEQFTAARPQNPLGHLELAAAYRLGEDYFQEFDQIDLLSRLSEASLTAPDLQGSVRYHAENWDSQYIYPTQFALPPFELECPTLFLHAGSRITWTLTLTCPAVLRFDMGLDPRSWDWGGDGATFEVWADGQLLFAEHLVVETARTGWQERTVDLTPFVGKTFSLALATTAGPRGDDTADWAGWGEPQIEDAGAAAYWHKVRSQPWLEEWQSAGVWMDDLLAAGEANRRLCRYDEAFAWFEWASWLQVESAELEYFKGLAFEDLKRWDEAVISYQTACEMEFAPAVTALAELWYRQGDYASGFEVLSRALSDYSQTSERLTWWQNWGLGLRSQKRWEEAFQVYDDALAEFPNDATLQLGMGLARYERGDGLDVAMENLQRALVLSGGSGDVCATIGELFSRDKRYAEADTWLQTALERNPGNRWIWVMRANNLRTQGNLPQSLQAYQDAIDRFPDFAQAYYEMAEAYRQNNQAQKAQAAIERSLALMNPPEPWFYVRAGEIYEWMGEYERALAVYRKLLSLDPTNDLAVQGINRLENK